MQQIFYQKWAKAGEYGIFTNKKKSVEPVFKPLALRGNNAKKFP